MLADDDQFRTLIRRAHDGDREAIGTLLERYRAYLRGVATHRLGSSLNRRLGISDVVQQTLMEAHENFAQFGGSASGQLRAWLGRIMQDNITNAIRDHLYTQKRTLAREQPPGNVQHNRRGQAEAVPSQITSPSLQASRIEESLRLLDELDRLPADQAAAVRMRYIECRSIAEIAAALDRSRTAAAGLVKRGMEKLRERLKGVAHDINRNGVQRS